MANRPRRPDELPNRWTEDDARRILREWAGSGLGLYRFARERGITAQRLAWWRKRLKASPLAPVSLVPAAVTVGLGPSGGIVVRLSDGITIELGDVSPTWVAELIRELARST